MTYVRDVLCCQKHNPAWPQEPSTQGCPACGLHVPFCCGRTMDAAVEYWWTEPALRMAVGHDYSKCQVLVIQVTIWPAVRPSGSSGVDQAFG